ncbi:MAG: hypothetical protein K9H49_17870 [Bacteroidales bacterium]|nr:hypothetical protein [Bacteroidales bacterium]MCF8390919.1 hypothetical protein [Bacteroidales bacterium]
MKYLFFFISLIAILGFSATSDNEELSLESANAFYNQLELKKSREILSAMLKNELIDNVTKCEVLKKLAFQDWKYYNEYNSAINRLMLADSIGFNKTDIWKILSRIERESRNFQRSLTAAEKSETFSKLESEKTASRLEYAQTVYDFSLYNLSNNIPIDTILISKTSDLLIEILESHVGSPIPSKLLLGISLLQNNGRNVIYAWKSYFQISDINNPYPYLAVSAKNLNEVCDKWHGKKLPIEKQEKLIIALSNSRFYEYADDFVLFCGDDEFNQIVLDFISYAKYLKVIKNKTNEYYREIAIGKENKREYKSWLEEERKKLWKNLSFTANKNYNKSDFLVETQKYFGAKGFTGSTGNYKGFVLCLGHIVNQEKATVEQYGYKPELTFTQIDMMTSNGYSSWFWEDKAIGGWATSCEIIQVREAYLNGPFKAWESINDSLERKKTENLISEFMNKPHADNNIYSQSEGLAEKLGYDALNDLYSKLFSEGLRGNELKLAFLSSFKNYDIEASIFAHEGRHFIDKKYFPIKFIMWSSDKKEYHAKLSELVFAPEPRLGLANMVNGIGESSGHELANKKIVETAVNWIKNNKAMIDGYSDSKSEFSQIYLLTTEQIKECFKNADPLFLGQFN